MVIFVEIIIYQISKEVLRMPIIIVQPIFPGDDPILNSPPVIIVEP